MKQWIIFIFSLLIAVCLVGYASYVRRTHIVSAMVAVERSDENDTPSPSEVKDIQATPKETDLTVEDPEENHFETLSLGTQDPAPYQIQVNPSDCRLFLRERKTVPADYQPGISTTGKKVASAEYQPGVSVTGKRVMPADLSDGSSLDVPDVQFLTLPVWVDLEKDFPFWASSLHMGAIPVATFELKNGKVYVSGRELSQPAFAALREACLSFEKK